jgi:tryptophan synthase alpha chain
VGTGVGPSMSVGASMAAGAGVGVGVETRESGILRLGAAFGKAKAEGRTALVCYAMGGDPSLAATRELVLGLCEAGADVIELGIPFSDPIADGPILQLAAGRALAAGTTLAALIELANGLQGSCAAPIVFMGYVNPILAYGLQRFAAAAARAGVCGAIVPDVPLEEAGPLREALSPHGLALIPLVAPTTTEARRHRIAEAAQGFLYAVSVTGVTGARNELPPELESRLVELRAICNAPVVAGFGIGRAEQAAALRGKADGVVVGSAIVAAHSAAGVSAACALVRELRAALS